MIDNQERFKATIEAIDKINGEDPHLVEHDGTNVSKELLYSQRMTEALFEYDPDPDEALQLAARGQHIKRWAIPRSEYPMDRKGYLQWRTKLKLMHASLMEEIMEETGYETPMINQVKLLINKNKLKTDTPSQQLEDVVCLVFLQYYYSDFLQKHNDEKVIAILQKTWGKMTEKGRKIALGMDFGGKGKELIEQALGVN